MTILDEILAHKRREVSEAMSVRDGFELAALAEGCPEPIRDFRRALVETATPRIIAEIKRCSPSRGEIRADMDPVSCAVAYAEAGAAAISVVTDRHYFGGELGFLERVRREVSLPLLRKDFIVDAYQVDEARVSGADAILLIVAAFNSENGPKELERLYGRAGQLGLDALVEVHDESELEIALRAGANLIGINNRNLHTFEVDLEVSERLAKQVTDEVVVIAESGIFSAQDIVRLEAAGVQACLVGEALMQAADIGLALRELRGSDP